MTDREKAFLLLGLFRYKPLETIHDLVKYDIDLDTISQCRAETEMFLGSDIDKLTQSVSSSTEANR